MKYLLLAILFVFASCSNPSTTEKKAETPAPPPKKQIKDPRQDMALKYTTLRHDVGKLSDEDFLKKYPKDKPIKIVAIIDGGDINDEFAEFKVKGGKIKFLYTAYTQKNMFTNLDPFLKKRAKLTVLGTVERNADKFITINGQQFLNISSYNG